MNKDPYTLIKDGGKFKQFLKKRPLKTESPDFRGALREV